MGIFSHGGERRRAYRSELRLWALFREYGTTTRISVIVSDLSIIGFKMQTSAILTLGDTIYLEISGFAPQEARIMREHREHYGCEFTRSLHQAVVDHIAASCRGSVGSNAA